MPTTTVITEDGFATYPDRNASVNAEGEVWVADVEDSITAEYGPGDWVAVLVTSDEFRDATGLHAYIRSLVDGCSQGHS